MYRKWLQHEIASVYRSLLFEVKSFLKKTLIEPKINSGTFHVYHVASSKPRHLHVLSPCPRLRAPFCYRFSSTPLERGRSQRYVQGSQHYVRGPIQVV
jgi:hypothetical protein